MKKETIEDIKNYIYPNGIHISQRTLKNPFSFNFPQTYEKIKGSNYRENLYMLYKDIKERPKCKNPKCNGFPKLRNFNKGFRKFCSPDCFNEYNKNNKEFSKAVSVGINKKFNEEYYLKKYGFKMKMGGNYFIIYNYCKHGDLRIYKNTFKKKIKNKVHSLCYKCIDKYIEVLKPNINECRLLFKQLYNEKKYGISETYLKLNHPEIYKSILIFTNNYKNAIFPEKIYMFLNNIKKRPLCKCCNKNEVEFIHSPLIYKDFCNSYNCKVSISKFELKIYYFIKSIYSGNIKKNYRIDNKEIDIYLPKLNLGIEANGLYWHCEFNKDKYYHQEKSIFFKNKGIKIIHIWEDDWDNKQEIIKSIIKNSIGKTENKIYARKCIIKEIKNNESRNFLLNNHLQGWSIDTIRYGLFYNNVLVSLMTFGKKRKLLGNKPKENEYELTRFANKTNTIVVGGASKLFNHFIKDNNPKNIISYANIDISNGNLYKKLGFNLVSMTNPGYWWVVNRIKENRSKYMKCLLIKRGYDKTKSESEIMHSLGAYRIWDSGNYKFEYIPS